MFKLGMLKPGTCYFYNGVMYTKVKCNLGQNGPSNFSPVYNHTSHIVSWMHDDCEIVLDFDDAESLVAS